MACTFDKGLNEVCMPAELKEEIRSKIIQPMQDPEYLKSLRNCEYALFYGVGGVGKRSLAKAVANGSRTKRY